MHRGRAGALLMRNLPQAATLQHDSLNHTALPWLESPKLHQYAGLSRRFSGGFAAERIELVVPQPEPLPPAWQLSLGPLPLTQAEGRSQFLRPGRSSECGMQLLREPRQSMLPFLMASRRPHHRCGVTQVMQDRSADVPPCIGAEGSAGLGIEELRSPDQAHQTDLLEVVPCFGTVVRVMGGDRSDQRQMPFDRAVATIQKPPGAPWAALAWLMILVVLIRHRLSEACSPQPNRLRYAAPP